MATAKELKIKIFFLLVFDATTRTKVADDDTEEKKKWRRNLVQEVVKIQCQQCYLVVSRINIYKKKIRIFKY